MNASRAPSLQGADVVRSRRTTQQLVHDVLRDAILSGEMLAGSRLIQDEIASQFQISRIPVREALLQLEAEGLIEMEAHRGARVISPSLDEVEENLKIRKLLLIPSVREAVPLLTDEQLDALEAIATRPSGDSGGGRGDHHADFYAAMLAPTRHERLVSLVVRLEREIERFCLSTGGLSGHRDILAACRSRDGQLAADLVERHMDQFTRRALAEIQRLQQESASPDAASPDAASPNAAPPDQP